LIYNVHGKNLQVEVLMKHFEFFSLRNETSVPVFYRSNKIWVRVWVRMN